MNISINIYNNNKAYLFLFYLFLILYCLKHIYIDSRVFYNLPPQSCGSCCGQINLLGESWRKMVSINRNYSLCQEAKHESGRCLLPPFGSVRIKHLSCSATEHRLVCLKKWPLLMVKIQSTVYVTRLLSTIYSNLISSYRRINGKPGFFSVGLCLRWSFLFLRFIYSSVELIFGLQCTKNDEGTHLLLKYEHNECNCFVS